MICCEHPTIDDMIRRITEAIRFLEANEMQLIPSKAK